MHTFITAYMNFYDNEMIMGRIEAEDSKNALIALLNSVEITFDSEDNLEELTEKDIKQVAFDCDCMIGVYQL